MAIPQNGRYVVRTQFAAFAAGSQEAVLNAASHDQTVNFDLMLASRAAEQERQQEGQVQACIGETGSAPPEVPHKEGRKRPADGACEALREPSVDAGEQRARLVPGTPTGEETSEARGGAQLEGPGASPPRDIDRRAQCRLRAGRFAHRGRLSVADLGRNARDFVLAGNRLNISRA